MLFDPMVDAVRAAPHLKVGNHCVLNPLLKYKEPTAGHSLVVDIRCSLYDKRGWSAPTTVHYGQFNSCFSPSINEQQELDDVAIKPEPTDDFNFLAGKTIDLTINDITATNDNKDNTEDNGGEEVIGKKADTDMVDGQ